MIAQIQVVVRSIVRGKRAVIKLDTPCNRNLHICDNHVREAVFRFDDAADAIPERFRQPQELDVSSGVSPKLIFPQRIV